ncbi:probable chitinase 2 [Malaya genurostris]|uniref:probable chitinase 2 n=1 Tax=Malaya genurostris TaxID=325434 RepID=UPI0026F38596|nr:probable chitinase 2 [Malaya genurostris]
MILALTLFLELKQRFRRGGDSANFVVSIGGINQKSAHFSRAVREESSRYAVIDNVITFVTKHGFDGVDIAWFYPGQFGGCKSDKENLILLLEQLHMRLHACGMSLSLTVGVDPRDITISYDVVKIDEYVDFVNLLTGDYHDPRKPSHLSPLYSADPKDRFNIVGNGEFPPKVRVLNPLNISAIQRKNLHRGWIESAENCHSAIHLCLSLHIASAR